MKNAVITAKLPSGKWECVFIGENITEAKIKYKQLIASESIEETTKKYLQFNLFYQPQMRKVSKAGRISEAEIKANAAAVANSVKDAAKILKEEDAAFEAELKAEEVAKEEAAAVVKKRQVKERKEAAAKKKVEAQMVKAKEDKKAEAFAEVVAAKMKGK